MCRDTRDSRPSKQAHFGCCLRGRKQNKKAVPSKGMQLSDPCSISQKLHTDVSVFADRSLPSSSIKLTTFWSGSELLLLPSKAGDSEIQELCQFHDVV